MCLKYMKGMLSSIQFTEKEKNHWRNLFSSSGNAIYSISLKYEEIDVQIHSLTKIETFYLVALLNGTNL